MLPYLTSNSTQNIIFLSTAGVTNALNFVHLFYDTCTMWTYNTCTKAKENVKKNVCLSRNNHFIVLTRVPLFNIKFVYLPKCNMFYSINSPMG